MIRGRRQDFCEVLEVGAESRETGKDRLLVTNVGVDVVEHRDAGAVGDGCGDSGLRQRGKQAERFQQNSFAAGVGSGDQQRSFAT